MIAIPGVLLALVLAGCAQHSTAGDQIRGFYEHSEKVPQAMAFTFESGQVVWDGTTQPPAAAPGQTPGFATASRSETLLFMHARKTKTGQERLVVINAVNPRSQHGPHLSTLIVEPGTPQRSPRHHGPDMGLDLQSLPSGMPLRFYGGQVDPADESHFTIEYDNAEGRRTVDGWLKDLASPSWSSSWVEVQLTVRTAASTEPTSKP
jgi:hypothetical protein